MSAHPVSPTPFLPGLFEPIEASRQLTRDWFRLTYRPRKTAFGGRADSLDTTAGDVDLWVQFWLATQQREPTLADFSDAAMEDFFVWRMGQKRCKSRSTANRSLRSLLAVWREAARKGLCYPPRDVALAKVDKTIPLAWSMDELGKLLGAGRSLGFPWYKPRGRARIENWQTPAIDGGIWLSTQIETAYYTGLRITALLLTPTVKLDLAAAGLLVPANVQKHRKEQFFPLPAHVVDAWRELGVHQRRLVRLGDDWPYDRKPGSNWKTLNNWLKRLLRAGGLVADDETNLRRELWHKLRRTFATHLAAAKGIEAARIWLGHSSISVTMRYIDMRFMPGINPVDALPRPTIPEAATVPFKLVSGQ